jgi:hypothetical protein
MMGKRVEYSEGSIEIERGDKNALRRIGEEKIMNA